MRLSKRSQLAIVSSFATAVAAPLAAQETATELDAVTVVGKADDLLGTAPAASEGHASSEDLLSRPILRRGEILETIPGVIITQHAGGGKANQYFLRGYNLDHGTDFATSLDGMPLNMRTHAHGQGYTDLNGVIPELVERLDYVKGTYTAANGDLSTAGSANFLLFKHLERNQATFEIGEDNYYRGLIAGSIRLDSPVAPADGVVISAKNTGKNVQPVAPVDPGVTESLTYALEYNTYDGPWVLPEDFERWNGLLRYFKGDEDNWFTATLMGYHGEWNSSDQIPERAVKDGRIDRFGTVDPTTGGHSQRYSLNLAFQTTDGDVVTTGNVYGIRYDLDLYSSFTYFLDYPDHGDQFQQKEERWVIGGNLARTWRNQEFFGTPADYTFGFQTRHDLIDPIGLYRTEARRRFATVREDEVYESSYSVYADSTVRWTDWFRTNIGVRGDVFYFDTSQSTLAANEGSEWDGIVSPKFSAVFGPWKETEFYLNYGMGFHSNDARGVNTFVDPNSGDRVDKVDPLVRTMGGEIGVRTQVVPHLTSTLALFWLESDSELVYIGDAGANEAGPGSRRYGIEFANYWRPVHWFSLDAEFAITHARFTDSGNEDYIPGSIPFMFSGGMTLGAHGGDEGFFATLRARAFDRRPLIEDNSVKGKSSFLVNAGVGYRKANWEAAVECLNLFDRDDNDIEYYYTSRLQNERSAGYDDVHLHPTEPRTFRLRVTYRF
ncbi:TonB-dependent receptor [Verrucomicrobium sp. BvORR106]|uniref:TonB-dependent receptor n=1 Tax=Verrucomicrobium sp. BvORR106 TaxID=1403819 RepID=UPI0007C752D4|nr:TonB-dependent receptor [Verrucomicrobium sp. BvORR106]